MRAVHNIFRWCIKLKDNWQLTGNVDLLLGVHEALPHHSPPFCEQHVIGQLCVQYRVPSCRSPPLNSPGSGLPDMGGVRASKWVMHTKQPFIYKGWGEGCRVTASKCCVHQAVRPSLPKGRARVVSGVGTGQPSQSVQQSPALSGLLWRPAHSGVMDWLRDKSES